MKVNDLYDFCENNNITLDFNGMTKLKSLSIMDDDGECYINIDEKAILSEGEKKVCLAHECGHCAKGAFYNRYSPLDEKSKHEARANRWAIEHLVSEEELLEAVGKGLVETWQFAEYFDIPQPFMQKILNYYNHVE